MRFLNNILAKAGLIVDGVTQLNTIANATIDTDKFLVSDGGVIKYRTGAELALDLGSLTASTLKHQVKLGEAIAKGQAVYVSSADGTNMIVSKASNATEATSSKTLGLLETGGALNAQVNVITEGLLAGLDTSTATAGDPVWLGTNGNLIFGLANKPSAPDHLVFIGIVTRVQSNNGEIFIKVQNGFELQELHNVAISSIANKDLLMYEAATSLWKNKTLGTVIGGVSTQYVKGDGTLGSFPDVGGGGGLVYYLNGGTASSVAGYYQMSKSPVINTGVDFNKSGDGLVCQFLTDANDPSLLSVPAGSWRIGVFASMAAAGNNSKFYVDVVKYDGTTFTVIGSSSGTPESVVNGTSIEYYTTTVAISTTALSITDRIGIRIYAVDNTGRTMTIHTQNSHLCDIVTTFPTGIASINGISTPSQYLSTSTTGTDFTISASGNTHYFNLPVASATVTGKLSSTDWSTFNSKQNALGYTPVNQTRTLTINGTTYDLSSDRTWSVGTVTSVGVSVPTGLSVSNTPVTGSGTIAISFTAGYSIPTTASQTNWDTAYNNRITSLTTTGTSGAATLTSNTLNIPQYQAQGSYITSLTGEATASGPGAASVTLTNSAVIGKVLTGLNVTGGSISATDSILTAFGKLQNQVNGLAGGVTYQGTWNASTNSPSLTSSVGTKGYYYVVSVAGSTNLNGITDWKLGDWAIFNGTSWEKVDNTDAVVSVNGFTGAVSLTTSNISEGTNLYYTDARARAAISLTTTGSSGAATYVSGVINVPQYTLAGLGGEPAITAGTTSQYWRGDKSWQTLNTTVVPEGTNLYYTDTRSRAALSFVAGSGAYNSSTGVITIPTNTNQLTNGAGFLTAESDTLSSVLTRGNTSSLGATFGTAANALYTGPGGFVRINTNTYNPVDGRNAQSTNILLANYGGDLGLDGTVDIDFVAVDGNSVVGAYPHVRIGYTGAYNDGINSSPEYEARGYFRIATRGEGTGGVLSDRLLIDYNGTLRLLNYTTNGFLKFSSSNGTVTVDTNTYLTAESDTLASVTSRGNTTTDRINVRGAGNQSGGNILMGNTSEGVAKWSYLTGAHYNGTSQSQGVSLIGGYSDASSNTVVIGGSIYEANPATEIQFWTYTSTTHNLGGNKRGVINSAGNWGIGTGSPTSRLHVVATGNAAYTSIVTEDNARKVKIGRDQISAWDLSDSPAQLYIQGNGSNVAMVTAGGSVGVGISPSYTFDVSGVIHNNAAVFVSHGVQGNASGFTFSGLGSNYGRIYEVSNDRWALGYAGSYGGASTAVLNWNSSGNVGIAVAVPSYKLHVAGDIYADGGWLRVSGQSGLYFETYGGGWNMSDTTFLRSYNSKSIYSGTGIFRTDAGDTGFQNVGTANWYMLDFGDRSASAGRYGVGLTSDVNNRTLSFHVPNHAAYSSSGNVPQFGWYSNGADQLMTLQSATGNLWTKGTISMAGNTVATQSWVTSQGYLTSTNTTFTYNASLTLTTSWQDTGVSNSNLTTSGVYMVTCYANDFGSGGSQYQVTYVGTMYWFAGSTNNVNYSEIALHHMGHADNDRYVYLRTRQTYSAGGTFLQIRGNGNNSSAATYTFTFKRLM